MSRWVCLNCDARVDEPRTETDREPRIGEPGVDITTYLYCPSCGANQLEPGHYHEEQTA